VSVKRTGAPTVSLELTAAISARFAVTCYPPAIEAATAVHAALAEPPTGTKGNMEIKPLPEPAKILLWDRKLREKPCERVLKFDEELAALGELLKSTCYHYRGCGIAAPQIGVFKQVCVVHYPEDAQPFVLVNPVIDEINSRGEQIDFESCLSLPCASRSGERIRRGAKVRRCNEVVYSYQDLTGARIEDRATGMLARIIQHETDHNRGIFYIDRIGSIARDFVLRDYQNFVKTLTRESA